MTYIMNDFDNNFETIQAMDNTVKHYNKHLKKNQYRVLNLLKQYSLKIIGYSHLKLQTIANALDLGKATVYRILKFLSEQGYITKIHTVSGKHKNNGANVYQINTYTQYEIIKEKNEYAKMNTLNKIKKDGKTLSQQALKYVKAKKETIIFLNLLNIFLSNKKRSVKKQSKVLYHNIKNSDLRVKPLDVPDEIYQVAKPFFNDEKISSFYRKTLRESMNHFIYDTESHIEIMNYAIKSLVKAKKKEYRGAGGTVKNEYGYFTGVVRNYVSQYV